LQDTNRPDGDTPADELTPIIYFAFRSKKLRGRIPPAVAQHTVIRSSNRCHARVAIDPGALRAALDLGQRTNRRVLTTCGRCCRRLQPDLVAGPLPVSPAIAEAVSRRAKP
jgi:hypothetical protein